MTATVAESSVLDNLCDALARGRLCLAELVLLEPPELEAMYHMGLGRIDAGRVDEAVTILQALVALYAYSAKYWRTLGLALHLGRHLEAAILAYQLALHLEPDHILTVCYLGELKLFCGQPQEAFFLLERASQSQHATARARASQLLGMPIAPPLPDVHPRVETSNPKNPIETFELTGGGPLPIPLTGTNTRTQPQAFLQVNEVTNKIFLADDANGTRTITETAIVRRPERPHHLPNEGSGTDTGLIDRSGDVVGKSQPGDAGWDFIRWFASAALRRRSAAPLLEDETMPTGPQAGQPMKPLTPDGRVTLPWAQQIWDLPVTPGQRDVMLDTFAAPVLDPNDRSAGASESVVSLAVVLDLLATRLRRLAVGPTILARATEEAIAVGLLGGATGDVVCTRLLALSQSVTADARAAFITDFAEAMVDVLDAAGARGAAPQKRAQTTTPQTVAQAIARIAQATELIVREAEWLLAQRRARSSWQI